MAKILVLLTLAAASMSAQSVEGTVTNVATGSPIPSVKVVLQQGDKAAYTASTDEAGHFRFEHVIPGDYSTRYSADRYFLPGRGSLDRSRIHVSEGAPPLKLEVRMFLIGRVGGRVVDARGDPVPKARVELSSPDAVWEAETDTKGIFELDHLIPVNFDYTLSASAPADWKPPAPDPDTAEPRAWARTFYPATPFRDLAAHIALPNGGDLLGLEIKLLAVMPHPIRGVLLAPDGAPVPKAPLALWEAGPKREAAYRAESKADGTFEFPAVPDGDWRLTAEIQRAGADLEAEEWITSKGRTFDALKVRLNAPFTLNGRVILEQREGAPRPEPPEVILLKRHSGQGVFQGESILSARPESDGSFRFENLYPGAYKIAPGPPPPLFYIDSIRLGDTPAPEDAELSSGSPAVTILYKTNGGTVRGTVEKCEMGQVWLVPLETPRRRILFGECQEQGRFQIAAVAPGEYYAVPAPAGELWSGKVDAALIRRATRITVRAGETTQADISLSGTR